MPEKNKEEFWGKVKNNLTSKNSQNQFLQTLFAPTNLLEVENLSENNKRFKLGVPTELHKHWISENLFDRICSEISSLIKTPFEVELVVTGRFDTAQKNSSVSFSNPMVSSPPEISAHSNLSTPPPSNFSLPSTSSKPRPVVAHRSKVSPSRDSKKHSHFLKKEYTFSSFVVGQNNQFAHAMSYKVACRPGAEGCNPLFICGPTGMGKTHLLHAIGNDIRDSFPQMRVRYVTAEQFLIDFVSSIRRNEMDRFRQRYRERCDLLLMDDIQFLSRGEEVQKEFFHNLNHFFENNRQVVVASDRMPGDIKELEDRIRTRLEWGLITDIKMPEFETRWAILRYKAEQKGILLPEEVSKYIAKISKRSIRQLEGNLTTVNMYAELQGLQVDLSLTKRVLAVHEEKTTMTIEEIQKLCAKHFEVKVGDLKSKSRSKPLLIARQVAMVLIKKHLDKSLVEIGRSFGNRDHTTVLNALKKMEKELHQNPDLSKDFEDLQDRIHNITGV